MGTWRVQRTNTVNGRFEWLSRRPTLVLGDPTATPPISDSLANIDWTSQRNDLTWRSGEPHDFGRRKAEKWAALIDADSVIAVRFGDADPDEIVNPTADRLVRKIEALLEYADSIRNGEVDSL